MKVFTYGIKKEQIPGIKRIYGEGEYIDATSCYQDILAHNSDLVIIDTNNSDKRVIEIMKWFEADSREYSDTRYIYL